MINKLPLILIQKKSDNEQQCFLFKSFFADVCGVIGEGIKIASLVFVD